VKFAVFGPVLNQATIAVGSKIREIARLMRIHGRGRRRKRKGVARIPDRRRQEGPRTRRRNLQLLERDAFFRLG
jgi:hypothetical protein